MPLAREIGTPNIKSKGALAPRTVQVPAALFPDRHPTRGNASAKIVEVPAAATPKGILKKDHTDSGGAAEGPRGPAAAGKRPELSWSKNALTEALTIHLAVPELVSPPSPSLKAARSRRRRRAPPWLPRPSTSSRGD